MAVRSDTLWGAVLSTSQHLHPFGSSSHCLTVDHGGKMLRQVQPLSQILPTSVPNPAHQSSKKMHAIIQQLVSLVKLLSLPQLSVRSNLPRLWWSFKLCARYQTKLRLGAPLNTMDTHTGSIPRDRSGRCPSVSGQSSRRRSSKGFRNCKNGSAKIRRKLQTRAISQSRRTTPQCQMTLFRARCIRAILTGARWH